MDKHWKLISDRAILRNSIILLQISVLMTFEYIAA